MTSTNSSFVRGLAAGASAIGACATLVACGSSGTTVSHSASTTAGANSSAQAQLAQLYKSTSRPPTGPPVKDTRGKSVWVITLGDTIESAVTASRNVQEAGKALGWKVTVVDGKFDPSVQLQGVEQAIAAKANAVILAYMDCAPVKTALRRAKQLGIVSVGIESQDCNPSLLSHVVTYAGKMDFITYFKKWGEAQATWVITKTGGKAKVLLSRETDVGTLAASAKGAEEGLATCPHCTVIPVNFTGADLGAPLTQKIQQAVIKNPTANAFIASYDAVLTGGGANVLQPKGRSGAMKIMGGEGTSAGMDLIRENRGMQAAVGLPVGWEAYAAVDAVLRLFAKQDPAASDSGMGLQVVDQTHNLPPAGQPFTPNVDYKSAYRKMWGIS
jgi:ribose transport system substrate-binding protein